MSDPFECLLDRFCREAAESVDPHYFRTRRQEFELVRMLAPDFFGRRYGRALELGCGIGFKALLATQIADHVDGVDMETPYHGFRAQEPSAEIGRALLEKAGVMNVHLFAGDLVSFMTARPNEYDLVYSDYLLEHVPDLPPLYDAMRTCLKPGGRILHVVPNTHDALIQMAKENLQPTLPGLFRVLKGFVKHRLLEGKKRYPKVKLNGMFIPITHSEFLDDYAEQFEVYRLESYVFPMMEAGFAISAIQPLREHSYAVSAEISK